MELWSHYLLPLVLYRAGTAVEFNDTQLRRGVQSRQCDNRVL